VAAENKLFLAAGFLAAENNFFSAVTQLATKN
jgi:hypothetical protein